MNIQTAEPSTGRPVEIATLMPPAHIRRIVLTGFMGAGKTTVGRRLAEHLNWEFLDLDDYVESRTGLAIPSIFAAHGELHFRKLESEALASALGRANIVLSLGGGAPETLTNRLLLEQTPATATIFLDAPFATLYDRCMLQALNPGATARPNLADPAAAERRFAVRHPIYTRLASHTVDTASLSTEQTVATLLARLHLPKPRRR